MEGRPTQGGGCPRRGGLPMEGGAHGGEAYPGRGVPAEGRPTLGGRCPRRGGLPQEGVPTEGRPTQGGGCPRRGGLPQEGVPTEGRPTQGGGCPRRERLHREGNAHGGEAYPWKRVPTEGRPTQGGGVPTEGRPTQGGGCPRKGGLHKEGGARDKQATMRRGPYVFLTLRAPSYLFTHLKLYTHAVDLLHFYILVGKTKYVNHLTVRGFVNLKKIQKSAKNSAVGLWVKPQLGLFFWGEILCFLWCFLLKIFQKKITNWIEGWVGGHWPIRVFIGFLDFF